MDAGAGAQVGTTECIRWRGKKRDVRSVTSACFFWRENRGKEGREARAVTGNTRRERQRKTRDQMSSHVASTRNAERQHESVLSLSSRSIHQEISSTASTDEGCTPQQQPLYLHPDVTKRQTGKAWQRKTCDQRVSSLTHTHRKRGVEERRGLEARGTKAKTARSSCPSSLSLSLPFMCFRVPKFDERLGGICPDVPSQSVH